MKVSIALGLLQSVLIAQWPHDGLSGFAMSGWANWRICNVMWVLLQVFLSIVLRTNGGLTLTLRGPEIQEAFSGFYVAINISGLIVYHTGLKKDICNPFCHRKYFWFAFKGETCAYLLFPFRLSLAPHVFSKCLWPSTLLVCHRCSGLRLCGQLSNLPSQWRAVLVFGLLRPPFSSDHRSVWFNIVFF